MSKTKVHAPIYIAGLLQPRPEQASDRRVWSIPLKGVLVPFFTATNAAGETAISSETLGCPLRLAKEKDGTPKFSTTGRPVVRVVKELSDQVRMMRENFISGLMAYTDTVVKGMPEAYKSQVEAAVKAGEPIAIKDADDLQDYLDALAQTQADTHAEAEQDKVLATA